MFWIYEQTVEALDCLLAAIDSSEVNLKSFCLLDGYFIEITSLKRKWLGCLALIVCFCSELNSQSYFRRNFINSTDNAVDLSKYLASKTGIIPLPIIITEPAVGFGGGLAAVYFHRDKNRTMDSDGYGLPPSMSALGGAITSNGSKVAMAAHQGSYGKDRFRYTGAIGLVDVNLAFYGGGVLPDGKLRFNMNGFLLFQEFSFRVKKVLPIFLGFNYLYFNNSVKFQDDLPDDPALRLEEEVNTAGLNLLSMWDRRDNIFTPNRGFFLALELGKYATWLGGDRNYSNLGFRGYVFTDKWLKKTVFGFRTNVLYKWGDVPFYELPAIDLRGIPALRYQDNLVNVLETEARHAVWRRWGLVGFVGVGSTASGYNSEVFKDLKPAGGLGFRYLLAKQYGLHLGIDVARGPEQFAWYLTFGSAWFR